MTEATHDDIVARIESLEDRMDSVEEGVRGNHQLATDIATDVAAHRTEFSERMNQWDGYLSGVAVSAKVFAWLVGSGIALTAVLSQI